MLRGGAAEATSSDPDARPRQPGRAGDGGHHLQVGPVGWGRSGSAGVCRGRRGSREDLGNKETYRSLEAESRGGEVRGYAQSAISPTPRYALTRGILEGAWRGGAWRRGEGAKGRKKGRSWEGVA